MFDTSLRFQTERFFFFLLINIERVLFMLQTKTRINSNIDP